METGLYIDDEKGTVRLVLNTGKEMTVHIPDYHRLKKWDVLIAKLDSVFCPHEIEGEDETNHSFKTFKYKNGISVHTEPYEFLLWPKDMNQVSELKTLIKSVGYEIKNVSDLHKGIFVEVPF